MNVKDQALVFLGTSDFARINLRHLIEAGIRPKLVVTQPDAAKRRSGTKTPSPVGQYALEQGLEIHRPLDVNTSDSLAILTRVEAPLFVVVAYGQKLSPELLAIPERGTVNVHASLLPKYRGAAPIQKAILEGDSVTGVSLIDVVEKMDAGDVLASREIDIGEQETAGELHDRLAELGGALLVDSMPGLYAGQLKRTPQDSTKVSWAKRLKKSDGALDFHRPAEEVQRFIRAMNPWPGAFATWQSDRQKEERLVLLSARAAPSAMSAKAPSIGEITRVDSKLFVQVLESSVEILQVQRSGKRPLPTEEFLRGARIETGDRLV